MKKYVKYIIELVVIVVGITLSFMVEEWRENFQNREETLNSLKLIRNELIQDSIRFEEKVKEIDLAIADFSYVYFNELEILNYDSAERFLIMAGHYIEGGDIQKNSFLKFTNAIKQPEVNNEVLIDRLTNYYDDYQIVEINGLIEHSRNLNWPLQLKLIPFLGYVHQKKQLKNEDQVDLVNSTKLAFEDNYFMNSIWSKLIITRMAKERYIKKVTEASRLINVIDSELL